MLTSMLWLFVLAALGWSFFMFLLKPVLGFSFIRTPIRTFLYFLLLTGGVGYSFFPITYALYGQMSDVALVVAGLTLFLVNPMCYAYGRSFKVSSGFAHPNLELLALDYRFLFSKVGDVLFQQTVISIVIVLLAPQLPYVFLVLVTAVVFLLGHLGLLFQIPHNWFLFFCASALIGGVIIPVLILSVVGGIYYAITLHMFWYVSTGIAFRYHEMKEEEDKVLV